MRITQITANNVIGAKEADISITSPVCMLVGGNGQGKTSILDAVRLALIAEPARGVNYKKDYAQLITEGASTGQAQVHTDAGENWLMLPTGKGKQLHDHPALPYVLDPARLAALKPADRKGLLFALLGVKSTAADVKPLMLARGLDAKKCERVLPMLRAGFEDAATVAAESATQAKGAWKQVTNEQWGSDKGSSWTAPQIEHDAAQLQRLSSEAAALDQQVAQANQALGSLRERRQAQLEQADRRTQLTAKAAQIDRLQKKLEFDEGELSKAQAELQACPGEERVGLIHDMAYALRDTLSFVGDGHEFRHMWASVLADYEKLYGPLDDASGSADPERIASLKASIQLLTNAVANDKRDLTEAQAAKAQLDAIDTNGEPVKESEIQAAQAKAQELTAKRTALTSQIDAANAAKRAADSADSTTAKAAELHAEIMQWIAIADALGPNGIPGELVGKALGPVNERLKQSAEDTGWSCAQIGTDMAITYGGRAYALLSESEKWRVDAMLGEAIAQVSGLRVLMLDRFDVLELNGRAQALAWLSTLAINAEIDTVLVGATLKSATGSWPEGVSAVRVANGMCRATAPTPAVQADLIAA